MMLFLGVSIFFLCLVGPVMAETGVYWPGAGFYLKMDNGSTWNPTTDMYLAWDNAANDLPIAGDWNSDGRTETGVYRPGAGFYLKMDNISTWAPSSDVYLAWDNAANDLPIAGDWNSDGRTETGVYRPGAGFYLKMDNGSAWNPTIDVFLSWDNAANDRPVAGDWNSDGRTETGVYRPGAGFYLKMDNGSAWNPTTDVFLSWDNAANDLPIAGDWNGDGRTETGVYRPGAGFYLKMDNISTWAPSSDVYLAWDNAANDLPVAVSSPQVQIVAPTAAFSSDVQSGDAPLLVRFTDQSINTPTSWKWEYQTNGTSTWTEFGSGARNTSFSFPAGTYDIRLSATNAGGSATKTETGYVTSSIPAPIAAFSSDIQSGYAPLTVRFTDQSINTPTSWKWEYQTNGTSTWSEFGSGAQNPAFSFPAGTYDIRLTATNAGGSAIKIETQYITSSITAPTAAFISDVQSGDAPLLVRFTDQSTNTPTSWKWKYRITGTSTWTVFGSDTRNPSFSFTAGTYDVQLTVTNDGGTDTKTKAEYITVTESPEAPSAAFTVNKVSGYAPLTVRFTDQSTGTEPLRYAWDFNNDGSTDSTAQSPSFTYSAVGAYTVKLKVTNNVGSDSTTRSNLITVTENQSGVSHTGIALTFDDDSVDAWYATREILQRYNAHVTFFVSNLGGLDQSEINELKLLQV